MKKTYYYEGKEGEDFFPTVKALKPLPNNYKYIAKNPFEKSFFTIIYKIIGQPFGWLYCKIALSQHFVGKEKLKSLKEGYFIYSNHTLATGDAFISNILSFKRKNYIIVGKETASLTPLLPLLRGVGAIPLYQNHNQAKDMMNSMEKLVKEGATITVFPEAHIWPLYNKIRDFPSASLVYPYKYKVPVVSMVNCYTKKRFSDKPKVSTIINGPYYFDYSLNRKEAINLVYEAMLNDMKETANKHSTYSYNNYIKVSNM